MLWQLNLDFLAKKIKQRIKQRLDIWDQGRVEMLVANVELVGK